MIRNRYKNDYSQYDRLNGKGRIVEDICYVGEYYILPFSQEKKKKTGLYNILFAVAIFIVHLGAGLLNQQSSRTAWIVYPYLFGFVPMGYMLGGALGYWKSPLKMQRVQYETGIERMRRSCIGIFIFTGLGIILDIVFMALHHNELAWQREIMYLLCHITIFGISLLFTRYYSRNYQGITTQPSEHTLQ